MPPYVHLASNRRHSRDRCSQAISVFLCFSASVYYTEWKPKNKKRGRPGNEAMGSLVYYLQIDEVVQWFELLGYQGVNEIVMEVTAGREIQKCYYNIIQHPTVLKAVTSLSQLWDQQVWYWQNVEKQTRTKILMESVKRFYFSASVSP